MIKLDDKKKAVVKDFGKRLYLIHLLRITSTEVDESIVGSALENLKELYQSVSLIGDSVQSVVAYFALMDWLLSLFIGSDSANEYTDDEDVSWKVRRAAAKCLAALIVSHPEVLAKLYEEKKPGEEEERKIPVLTVLRNGAILEHIFVISKSPLASPASSEPSIKNEENIQETEEILTFGRHPDCNIVLNHPSIRRFHLHINSKTFSRKLFVTDLFSDHGTWNPGKKIPGLRVELNEDDTIKVGGSTRYYRLLWVPMSRAYDMETPFISPSDLTMIEEKREENVVFEEDESLLATENKPAEVKMYQDENLVATETESVEKKS
uniref:FHA domain-containing protein n=1 Tax=Salix viminalis TaxID=40686 RepID=A0A6N2LZF9_SALVM